MTQTNTINLDDCWLYASFLSKDGYGIISHRVVGKWTSTTSHRAMYEHYKGVVPQGLSLDHLCEIKSCVNPNHLEIVTVSENTKRRKRRCPHCGEVLSRIKS